MCIELGIELDHSYFISFKFHLAFCCSLIKFPFIKTDSTHSISIYSIFYNFFLIYTVGKFAQFASHENAFSDDIIMRYICVLHIPNMCGKLYAQFVVALTHCFQRILTCVFISNAITKRHVSQTSPK